MKEEEEVWVIILNNLKYIQIKIFLKFETFLRTNDLCIKYSLLKFNVYLKKFIKHINYTSRGCFICLLNIIVAFQEIFFSI